MLDWVLLGSGSNPILEYSNESHLEEGKNKRESKAPIRKEAVVTHISQKMGFGYFCGLYRDHGFVCA